MALDFGKLDYSVSLNRTSAFPLDAKSYFESLSEAQTAAASAEEAGSKNTSYYFGQVVAVVENNLAEIYVITPAKTLKKLGENTGTCNLYVGYYLNNEFYKDTTYTETLPHSNSVIYADLNGTGFYRYTGELTKFVKFNSADIPDATAEIKGIMKLYNTHGQNTDGTMTQKAITDGVKEIKFALETVADEDGDGEPENVLVLDLPW